MREAVAPGSSVLTDGWSGYAGLSGLGYDHLVINQSASPDPAHVPMPAVHRIAALLKRWLVGTYQGAVSREHLDYYLDEYMNMANMADPGTGLGEAWVAPVGFRCAQGAGALPATAVAPQTWGKVKSWKP